MKAGDRVIIKNASKAWDKEVYFKGWGLSGEVMWRDKFPNVTFYDLLDGEDEIELSDGMTGVLGKPFDADDGSEGKLIILLDFFDDNDDIATCHSQNFSIEELKEIVKVISSNDNDNSLEEDESDIKVTPIAQRVSSENFTVEVYEDEMYINDNFVIATDEKYVEELINVLKKVKEIL